MPQPAQDHLHRLIHSMSRLEKRYFKLYTSRHAAAGTSNHQLLFDAVAAMPVYDLGKLRKQFEGCAFMRRFAITKRRLYEAVLNSLDAFHAGSSVDDKLHRALHHVELLFDRALHADAAKVLHGVRALARSNDRQAILLLVAEWERRIMERSNYSGVEAMDLAQRAADCDAMVQEWQQVEHLWQIKSRSFMLLYRTGQAPGPKELTELEALAREPMLAEGTPLHTARARFLQHHVRSAIAYAGNDLTTCEYQLTAAAEVLRREQDQFRNEPDLMLGVMGNLAHVRMRLGRHQQALDGFRAFRKLPLLLTAAPNRDLEMKLFVMGTSLELSVHAAKGDFNLGMQRLPELEAGLTLYGHRISAVRRVELLLQAAYASFGAGHPDQALRLCNRMLGEKDLGSHADLYALGRMLNLVVLVEMGKWGLLEYLLRNTRRHLKQHGTIFHSEPLLLDHVQALSKAKAAPARQTLWTRLSNELAALAPDSPEAAALDHLDLLSWARGHADDKPFAEVVKARWGSRAQGGTRKLRGPREKRAA